MLSNDEAQSWLAAAFPGRPGWTIADHRPAKSFQQQMDLIELAWPATGETATVFVRTYRSYLSWWTLVTPDLPEREYVAWSAAQQGGVPVAPLLYRGAVAGQQGAVIGTLPGATGAIPDSPAFVARLAETLARLHSAPIGAHARAHLPDCTLPSLLSRIAAWVDEVGSDTLRCDLTAIKGRLAAVSERPAGLVHGDFHPGNIVVDGERIVALIDWEEAALGDPRIDLCWAVAALQRQDERLAGQFVRSYEELAGCELGELSLWSELMELRYLAARGWIMHALASGRALPSANPEAWPE